MIYDEYIQNINIKIENKDNASAVEAAKLLKSLEQETEKRVINAFKINDTEIECAIISFQQYLTFTEKIICKFKINGKEHIVDCEFNMHDKISDVKKFTKLRDVVAEYISTKILADQFVETYMKRELK